MPVSGLIGNKFGVGAAVLCENVTDAGVLFDHGLPDVPAGIFAIELVSGAKPAGGTLGYDKDNSTSTQMKLWTSAAGPTDWIVFPVGGEVDW